MAERRNTENIHLVRRLLRFILRPRSPYEGCGTMLYLTEQKCYDFDDIIIISRFS